MTRTARILSDLASRVLCAIVAFLDRLRRRGIKSANQDIDERELCFDRIWEQLIRTGATRHRSDLKRPNVLVLQMAKVASTSVRSALNKRKINAFHCHGLSAARQERDLDRLRRADLTAKLIKRRLRQHLRYVCFHMLVRWYQKYDRRYGRKLKVITLTRDPVDRFASNFMQHRSTALPQIISWQRTRLGKDAAMPIDDLQAVQDFVAELASVIVTGRPSAGAEACRSCEALARERWPQHFIVEDEISEWLKPLTWFETEIEQVFGLDVLATGELRKHGWAEAHNDWVEVLVLRFEDLAKLTPEIGRFVNVTELVLPRRNVTASKDRAGDIMSTIQATLSSPIGRACAHELWKSRYSRACGYPLPGDDSTIATSLAPGQRIPSDQAAADPDDLDRLGRHDAGGRADALPLRPAAPAPREGTLSLAARPTIPRGTAARRSPVFARSLLVASVLLLWPCCVAADPLAEARLAVNQQDFAAALTLFELEARRGNAAAMNELGYLHLRGHGVVRDCKRAYMWFSLAISFAPDEALWREAVDNQFTAEVNGRLTSRDKSEAHRLGNIWLARYLPE